MGSELGVEDAAAYRHITSDIEELQRNKHKEREVRGQWWHRGMVSGGWQECSLNGMNLIYDSWFVVMCILHSATVCRTTSSVQQYYLT